MNLPNALTIGRIAITPLLVWLPLTGSAAGRFVAFVLFLAAGWTDYYDGVLARTRGLVTDLGKMLDPLADKLLLVGTFVPMFYLQAPASDPLFQFLMGSHHRGAHYPFVISVFGTDIRVAFPWWVAAIVLGRELAMTIMRQIAARRGTIIAAIFAAKVKTVVQLVWVGAAYFWFFVATVDFVDVTQKTGWGFLSNFAGIAGALAMAVSVMLTLYTLGIYVLRFGPALMKSDGRSSIAHRGNRQS
ncbi:MAG TPA: CDP-alcohol phosphatidyltransferase family protein [Gemmatimonadaceae bacterium]|nr:CDP-alcohol phosphatidyltransferase family protein [Gemmatimonadaceae bacterium]